MPNVVLTMLILIIDRYIQILQLSYIYNLERKQQIVAKLNWPVMYTPSMMVDNNQGETK